MIKLDYTDENTLVTEEVEFTDQHHQLAKDIHDLYKSELWTRCTPLIVGSDKKSLKFGYNLGDKEKDIAAYERGDNRYVITIKQT